MATTSLYPLSTKEELVKKFVGKSIRDVLSPAAVLDLSKVKNNCRRMLDACHTLNFGWRAHIKTHKTTELTRLQVGVGPGSVNLCVSTIIEAENIVPLLLEYKSKRRTVNVLYAFPLTPSAVPRLALIAKALGPHGLALMIDHPAQLPLIVEIQKSSGVSPDIFLKIDVGDKRAGIHPLSTTFSTLVASLLDLMLSGTAHLNGIYSHAGQSYYGSSPVTALEYLNKEFSILLQTAKTIKGAAPNLPLILSVGATPQASAIRNLLIPSSALSTGENAATTALRTTTKAIRDTGSSIEIHAGVYTVLDLQQLSTAALPTSGPHAMLTWDDLALTIVAEIASVYHNRGTNGTTEYLLAAGCLALGREPCKAYPGFGILTPWHPSRSSNPPPNSPPETHEGWIVGRVSQEHGTVTWKGEGKENGGFEVGQKVRLWPNHACIAGAGFGWYFVVDGGDEVVDVWPRWRGW